MLEQEAPHRVAIYHFEEGPQQWAVCFEALERNAVRQVFYEPVTLIKVRDLGQLPHEHILNLLCGQELHGTLCPFNVKGDAICGNLPSVLTAKSGIVCTLLSQGDGV